MKYEIKKQNIIEPEIINERGENLSRTDACGEAPAGRVPGSLRAIIGAVAGVLVTVTIFLVFALIAVIIIVPVLLLSLFGKKPDIKIFKYRNFRI
jgi:hypothetical protein